MSKKTKPSHSTKSQINTIGEHKTPIETPLTTEVIEGEVITLGRKPKYSPDMIKKMLVAMEQGADKSQVMKTLGICRDTFYRWLRENEEFKDAFDFGEVSREVFWDNVGKMGIMNPKTVSAPLYIAYMKRHFKEWRDSNSPEGGTTNVVNIGTLQVNNLKTLTSEQIEEEIQKRLSLRERELLNSEKTADDSDS